MRAPGTLLASGRDAYIYEYGPASVLRRARNGRSMAHEAQTMTYLSSKGYPVPAVEEISEDGTDLVMERVEGVSMVEALGRAPWTVRRQARVLADLHQQLHDLGAPDFLPTAPVGSGDRVLHLDLHPLNVLVGPLGPRVIDWTSACAGDPGVDVALAWVLMAAGEIPGSGPMARVLAVGRSLLVNSFIGHFDRAEITPVLGDVVEWKARDPHMSEGEVAAMRHVVEGARRKRRS
jgi:aminoglycoside phosphotransferase (APT) family kinase protein